MNKPLMHATIELAARLAERTPAASVSEALAIARSIAVRRGLDAPGTAKLEQAAEYFAAPLSLLNER